jgi:hypothetical protein
MHLAESIGLHQEIKNMQAEAEDSFQHFGVEALESRRAIFWVAVSLNRLLAAEYGRSRVYVDNITYRRPSMRRADFTSDLIAVTDLLPGSNAQDTQPAKGFMLSDRFETTVSTIGR